MKHYIAHSRMFRLSLCCLLGLVGSSLWAQTPPTNVSVSPSSGSGLTQTFAFTSYAPSGVNGVHILFNYGLDGSGACYVYFTPSVGVFYLLNDTATAWTAGTGGTIENSQCALNISASSTSGSAVNFTLNLALTFKAGLPGAQKAYMYTYDNAGLYANWQQMGTWTTSSVSSAPPTLISATPSSGGGFTQTFTYTASSVNSYYYLATLYMLFNSSLNGTGACYVIYNRLSNTINLMNDAGSAWSGVPVGTAGMLSNSQCSVDTVASYASASGNNVTVNLAITFKTAWAGAKSNFFYVGDRGGNAAGWQQMGTWTVGAAPPSSELNTYYTYDLLNHLTQVSMPRSTGTQTRTFNYDPTTQRLTSATNPENGTVNYTYNGDGTLATRIDAKNQKIAYFYDGNKRVTEIKRYPVSTGAEDVYQRATFYYDTNPFDGAFSQYSYTRPTAVEWGGDANAPVPYKFRQMYSYTPGGLVTKKRVTTINGLQQSASLETWQAYDNEGRVLSVKYPDAWVQTFNGYALETGKTYSYTYDGMGRPTKLTDNQSIDWAKDVVYGAASELKEISYREPSSNYVYYHKETRTYNSRLQMTNLKLEDTAGGPTGLTRNIDYVYSATQNNGQIIEQRDLLSGGEALSYAYDSLQRLIAAVSTAGPEWGQSFSYDGFGNRTAANVIKGTAPASSFGFDAATNRITNSGFSYDANGNMYSGGGLNSAAYDIENRMVGATTGSGTEQYAYGIDNKRIYKKKADGTEEFYFYGIGGQRLGTYMRGSSSMIMVVRTDATGEGTNVYFGSKMILSKASFTTTDRLGSYVPSFPYGEEKPTATAQDREKFATYYRDSTGLDYADQRYYANTLGRFTSPDPYKASAGAEEPSSWNRYAYVKGDAVNYNDALGLMACFVSNPSTGVSSPYPCGPDWFPKTGSACGDLGFLPNSDQCVGSGPLPEPEPEQPPSCSITLFTRGVPFEGSPGNHTYIEVTFLGAGIDSVLEGGPTNPHNPITNRNASWGNLIGYIDPVLPNRTVTGGLNGTNPATNRQIGSERGGWDVCDDVLRLLFQVKRYNAGPLVAYAPRPNGSTTFNSNGFTFTLLSYAGLSRIFTPFIGWSPGWGQLVPGL